MNTLTTNFDFVSAIFNAMSKVKNDLVSKLLTNKQSLEATVSVRLSETHGARIGVVGEFTCN